MTKKIAVDELPKRLIANGKKITDVIMVYGFVGESTEEDAITFYFDPLLNTSVIIKNEDIIHDVKITKTHSAIGGTILWIKNASAYTQSGSNQSQNYAAQLFQGAIYQQYSNTVQNNPATQPNVAKASVCGCGQCGR